MAIDMKTAKAGLDMLMSISSESKSTIKQLGLMPNMKFKTMGGNVVWNNLLEHKGWKIQRNSITSHCRIIDSENIRHAWGSEEKINELFTKLADVPK